MEKRKLFVFLIIVVLVSSTLPKVTSYPHESPMKNSKELCSRVRGQVITFSYLDGISKDLLIKDILRRANEKPYLKKPLAYLDNVSTVLAWSSLRRVDEKIVRRDVIVIPFDDTSAIVYLRDSALTPTILSKDITLYEELIVFKIDPLSKTAHVTTRVKPLDGWSPVCSNTICTSDSDCPDRSSEGLYFPSCSDSCKDCTDWDYYCVAVYALNAGVCLTSCTICLFGGGVGQALGCAGCIACILMTQYTPDVYESCCEGQIVKKCQYYEWWD